MTEENTSTRRPRLTAFEGPEPIEPFVAAEQLTRCELYWLPSIRPATRVERNFTLRFIDALVRHLAPKGELTLELFIEAEAIYPDRQDQFTQTALDFNPVMGFSRAPGEPLPSVPKDADAEAVRRQERPFDLKYFLRGICYWFMLKQTPRQLDMFWGFGGMSVMLVAPDPAAQAPKIEIPEGVMKHPAYKKVFEEHDVPGLLSAAFSVQSGFLKKSKEFFGKGWEDRLEYRGLLFVVPRWGSRHFFNLPEEEVKQLFEVCDVFIRESPEDQGVLLASAKPLRRVIYEVLEELREQEVEFPGAR